MNGTGVRGRKAIFAKKPILGDKSGFTVPELITVLVVSSLFVSIILVYTINYWSFAARTQAGLDLMVDRMNASDILREYIGTSSGLVIQNSIEDLHPGLADGSISPPYYWQSIHAIPGTTTVGTTGSTPVLYFRKFSYNTSNTIAMNGAQPYQDEYVLFIDNTTKKLMLRSLSNPSASNNKLLTSCPAGYISSTCPTDKTIIENLASIQLRYFSRSGNLIDYTSSVDSGTGAYNGPDFPTVEVVELTLNLATKPIFQTSANTTNSTVIRIALRNT